MARSRPMIFNILLMNTPSHITHGMWRHPENRSVEYNSFELWLELARLAERAKLDAIFLADAFGMYADFGGSWDALAEHAVQFPVSDPSAVVAAMASHTKDLGFIWTNSILQQHPFTFARVASTIDHLSKGRAGWNIVTGGSENGARSMGLPALVEHEQRYGWAEEYTEVTYKLWEGSWEEGAVLKERTPTGLYADSKRIHKINHVGGRYSVEGPHLVEPSPQRTPVLVQAGSSPSGLAFAAKHAECVFMISGPPEVSAKRVTAVRGLAEKAGRDLDDLLFVEGMTIVVGSTEEEAQRKKAEYDEWVDTVGVQAFIGGSTGLDLSTFDPDQPAADLLETAPGLRSAVQLIIDTTPGRTAKVSDFLRYSLDSWTLVGTPETIADRMEEYQAIGVDGVNVMSSLVPGTYVDFVNYVAPELRRRGLMQSEYGPGTLREKLFPGHEPRLPNSHPAAAFRHAH